MNKPATLQERIRRWWVGEFIPYENDPRSELVFVGGRFKRHWTARLARWVVELYRREWKWLLAFAVTVVSVIVAIKKL